MTSTSKILLSFPSLLGIINLTTFLYPKALTLITTYLKFQTWDSVVLILMVVQVGFILSIIWKSDFMEAKDKRKWTALAIIFNSMSCLWFIWIEYDKLKKITTAPNNVYDS